MASMSRAHFRLIADTLKANKPDDLMVHFRLVEAFIIALKQTNPSFDEAKFRDACIG